MEFIQKIRLSYPWPLTQAFQSYRLEMEVRSQVISLVKLLETTTRYLAILTLSTCDHLGVRGEAIENARLGLSSPSFGHWLSIYRESYNLLHPHTSDGSFPDKHPLREATKVLRSAIASSSRSRKYGQFSFLDSVVEFRNSKIGHGELSHRVAHQVHEPLLLATQHWILDTTLLEEVKLVYIKRVEYEHPEFVYIGTDLSAGASLDPFIQRGIQRIRNGQVYFYDDTNRHFLSAHPLIWFDEVLQVAYLFDKVQSSNEILLRLPAAIPAIDTDLHFLTFDSAQLLKPGPPIKPSIEGANQEIVESELGEYELAFNIESDSLESSSNQKPKVDRPWLVTPPIPPSPALAAAVGGHPLVAQLLAQRGIDTPADAIPFLDPDEYTPAPPSALVGLDRAAHILHDAIRQGQRILVWGDFDVDGQTSTSLLVAALRELAGEDRVSFHVPNRFTESHGIRPAKLQEFLSDPARKPDLILTCDTGISDGPGVGLAKDAGVTVVVTDHHDLTAEFADYTLGKEPACGFSADEVGRESVRRADALVNPKFLAPGDPLRTLPGVGVAYKLVQRLYELADRAGEAVQFLDLVALGIVADVAEQVNDARYLLQRGLERLRRTERIGLKALIHTARLNPETLDSESIGFQLGPRMNALGRLDDATVAVELLTTPNPMRAGQLAGQMERLNNQRRLLTSQISGMAFEILEKQPHLLDFNVIVLAHPNWHAGIVGIVASRIVEEFGKPAVLLLNPPGEPARGSARSTPGVDIGSSIAACADLLIGFGGHAGAAGLSLEADKIDHFRRELSRQIDSHRIDAGPEGLVIDAELRLTDLSLHLVEQVQRLAPFGQGNPTPVFMTRGLAVAEDRRMGRDGTHRRLVLQDEKENKQPLVWFNGADEQLPEGPLDIAYTLNINEYKGERTVQLMYRAIRAAEADDLTVVPARQSAGQPAHLPIHDLRRESLDRAELPSPDAAFWLAEGTRLGEVDFHSRLQARRYPKGRPLVLWSAPPSAELLHWLVETLAPSELWLVGRVTGDDTLDGVLKSVAAMGKHALAQEGGRLPIDRLAARIGVTEGIVRHALFWLEAKRILWVMEWEEGDVARIAPGDAMKAGDAGLQEKQAELAELLGEMRAWRRYFLRAGLAELGLSGK